ncbi:hypothetical protein PT274_03305 [Leuconostocaceae bacterium ESL0958]|nr:hypothetical protein [Leuconostocaceae bacterium ESL0958]
MSNLFLKEADWLATVKTYFEQDYQERGKVKWQGFLLSDHTAQLKKMKRQSSGRTIPEQQSQMTIQQRVLQAYQQHQKLVVQVNTVDVNQNQPAARTGFVTAVLADGFDLDYQHFPFEEIAAVEIDNGK